MLYTALFRVIQMNMEMSLLSAHLLILFDADPQMMNLCRIVSILIHMFYVTCFVFTFLEALHTYSLVAFVVKRDGLLTRKQNIAVGWGSGISITMIVVSLEWKNYGGKNHQTINIQQDFLTSILRLRKEIFTKKTQFRF